MNTIIGISGRKQSGKNTVANYICGEVLTRKGMVQDFRITEEGQLKIKTSNSEGIVGWGIFDVTRKDTEFLDYAEQELFPFVKLYHFADYLKKICIELFGLSYDQVYGTDAQKNTNTNYNMTAREFLQYFGTEVMRKIKDDIWVSETITRIQKEKSEISIIPDVRFPNEVEKIKQVGGIVIRLTRDVGQSNHACETALDQENYDWNNFDYIINNKESTIEKLCNGLSKISSIWR